MFVVILKVQYLDKDVLIEKILKYNLLLNNQQCLYLML